MQDVCLQVGKGLQPLAIVENLWFRRTIWNLEPKITFPNRATFTNKHLKNFSDMVTRDKVKPRLELAQSVTLTFDLWMSRKAEDVFSLCAFYITPD
jgi:hypothetical protein